MTAPSVLAPKIREALRQAVQTSRLFDKDGELSASQAGALARLRTDAITVSRYAQLAGITHASASQQINRLQDHGLVTRLGDADDARRVLVSITEDGLAELRGVEKVRNALVANVLEDFDDEEREALARALPVMSRLFKHIAPQED